MPAITPHEFVAKWKNSELKERSSYQEHFIDLCRLVNHQTPAEMDPNGSFFTFEAGAAKMGGGKWIAGAWIDKIATAGSNRLIPWISFTTNKTYLPLVVR